jgi:uncharacterized protein (TIGR03067 family)
MALGSDAPREYDGETGWDDGLQGAWASVSYTRGPDTGEWVGWGLSFSRGEYEFRTRQKIAERGTYKVGLRRGSHHLDLTPVDSEVGLVAPRQLYQVDGDTLRVAWKPNGGGRPKSFDEDGILIVTYKRVK